MVAVENNSNRPIHPRFLGMATACPVRIIYGASDLTLNNIVGQSVATIHIWTREVLNAPRWCIPFINGQRVGRHHRVLPGDTVEFVYPWGFKGSDEPMTPVEVMAWRGLTTEQYEQLLRRGLPAIRVQGPEILHQREAVKKWFSVVPPGAPKWITGDEIEDTLRVWQRYYRQLLTADDALEILINVHNLLDLMYPKVGEGKEAMQ
jgi:hypothetical protein